MKTLMHVTEVSSGGVLPLIVSLSNCLVDKYNVIVIYGIRPDTPSNIREMFDSRVNLIPMLEFKTEISLGDINAFFALRKIISKYNPDIIHLHSTKAGVVGRLATFFLKKRIYYTPHGYCFLKKEASYLKRLIYRSIEKVLAYTNCITVACGHGEYILANQIRKNALLVANGIDVERIDRLVGSVAKKEKFVVYTAGRISHQKNPILFNEVAKRMPDIKFVWIGDGEDRKFLTSKNITVTGFVDRDEVYKLAAEYSCYLSCSFGEGFPMALMEAMYMRKVCIVSDVRGNNDLIIDKYNGVIATEVEEVVKAISTIKKCSFDYGVNAYLSIENKYTEEKMCELYKKIYG